MFEMKNEVLFPIVILSEAKDLLFAKRDSSACGLRMTIQKYDEQTEQISEKRGVLEPENELLSAPYNLLCQKAFMLG